MARGADLDNEQGDGALADRLQDGAQDAHGRIVVPVMEDHPEHIRVPVARLWYRACAGSKAFSMVASLSQ